MAFAPDARADPAEAFRVNVGGTVALFEALRQVGIKPAVLVTSSSEVYGPPRPQDLPLNEFAPVAPTHSHAISKIAQKAIALEASARYGFPVVVTRSFNHTGPGQRPGSSFRQWPGVWLRCSGADAWHSGRKRRRPSAT
jgi:GDP-4-dehydro-6-deoxy-D-mannose reductase